MSEREDFFKFAFSVTCAVFGFDGKELKVLVVERAKDPYMGEWALPSRLITLEDNVEYVINDMLTSLLGHNVYHRQLRSFFDPERHPLGRVVAIPYYGMIDLIEEPPIHSTPYARQGKWVRIEDLPALAFDHQSIVAMARKRLKVRVPFKLMGQHFLPHRFTMALLLALHEAILETELDKRNFSKKIMSIDLLIDTHENLHSTNGRPARLYEFNPDHQEHIEV